MRRSRAGRSRYISSSACQVAHLPARWCYGLQDGATACKMALRPARWLIGLPGRKEAPYRICLKRCILEWIRSGDSTPVVLAGAASGRSRNNLAVDPRRSLRRLILLRTDMDILSDVLRVIRLNGALFFTAEFSAPWSLASMPSSELAPMLQKRSDCIAPFHILVSGECSFSVGDEPPVHPLDLRPKMAKHVA